MWESERSSPYEQVKSVPVTLQHQEILQLNSMLSPDSHDLVKLRAATETQELNDNIVGNSEGNVMSNASASASAASDSATAPATATDARAARPTVPIFRRGHPLADDLRARVMKYLQEGVAKATIAKNLCISRCTVRRYERSAREQNQSIPKAKPRGGYRSAQAMLNRTQILELGQMLLQKPKLTIRELKQLAIEQAVIDPNRVPSDTTVWRAMKKLDLDFAKAVYIDPKGVKPPAVVAANVDLNVGSGEAEHSEADQQSRTVDAGTLIAAERSAFRFVQRQGVGGQLNPNNLLFMDEMNSTVLEQAHYAWGRKHERTLLFRPKGMSQTFNVIACIGVEENMPGQMFLHYIIVPPRRDARGVPPKFKSYEFRNPNAGIDLGYSVAQIQRLPINQLRAIMHSEQLREPTDLHSIEATEVELRRILVQVRTKGKVGMYRELPRKQRYLGGAIKAFRSTAADVVEYIEKLMIPFYTKRKFQGLVSECNEDSDGLIGCPDAGHHFSVAYTAPASVVRLTLLQNKQRTQRQWQRAAHHLLVYSRSKRVTSEAGQLMMRMLAGQEQSKRASYQQAADTWERLQRQKERPAAYAPFQDELVGAGYRQRLTKKYLVWDCASTHGAVKITSARKKSFWHGYAHKIGMKGVIFLPPRTPTLNPIELVFGFVKHHIRKHCPDEGYSSAGLMQAVHDAFHRVTPSMIRNWVKKSGYRFHAPPEANPQSVEHEVEEQPVENDVAELAPHDDDGGVRPMDIDSDEQLEEGKVEDRNAIGSALDILEADDIKQADREQEKSTEHSAQAAPRAQGQQDQGCFSTPGVRFMRKRHLICMDERGTVVRKKQRGHLYFDRQLDLKLMSNPGWKSSVRMEDVAPTVLRMDSVTALLPRVFMNEEEAFADVGITRRWSGVGPEPVGLHETMPDSVSNEHDGTLWEIDGIVEHKHNETGLISYLVRYKGYGPEYDEWFEEGALETASGAIKEYWTRKARQSL